MLSESWSKPRRNAYNLQQLLNPWSVRWGSIVYMPELGQNWADNGPILSHCDMYAGVIRESGKLWHNGLCCLDISVCNAFPAKKLGEVIFLDFRFDKT